MGYEKRLGELAKADERVLVMTAENRALIRSLSTTLGDRFVDVGICEQTLVGSAAGLALRGRKPVVHALAAFLTMRSFEFVRTDVAFPNLPVTLIGFIPGVLSDGNGPTHQAIEDVGLMRGIPNMQVFCPADSVEAVASLEHAISSEKPTYIRYCDRAVPDRDRPDYVPGKAEVIGDGSDVALVTYGYLTQEVIGAAEQLRSQGLGVRVVNLRTVVPLDEQLVIQTLREVPLVVTVEDHFVTHGLRPILCELAIRERLSPRVEAIGFEERWFVPAIMEDVLREERLDVDGLVSRVSALAAQGRS